MIVSRVVLLTILIGTLLVLEYRYSVYHLSKPYLSYLAIAIYLLAGLYWYLLEAIKNQSLNAYLQISVDIIFISVLVHLTGGIDSGFSILYYLIIIAASIVLYRRGGYLAASFASILYGAMLDMQYYNVWWFTRNPNFTAVQVMYQVFINILSFYTIALLSGHLAERLRRTRQELRDKSIDFEDLRALQEHIFRGVASGIVTLDLDGRVTSWNPAAESITGYRFSEIKHNWQDVFGQSIKGLFGHTDDLKDRPYGFEGSIVKKDGSRAILGMTASLLKDEQDKVRGIILIFQDVTKLIEMEEQVRRQERLATVGSLAAGIAHEIRNPLASLSGSIQVLKKDLQLADDHGRLMDIVVRETDRLNAIITEFLEYARPLASKPERVALGTLIQDTVLLIKNSRDFHEGITIDCTVNSDIVIAGDPQRLRQVFWNLLINACQALRAAGKIKITASKQLDDSTGREWTEILVSDTGPGISPELRSKIFDPFYTTKNGGTGLGLAIAFRILEDHGGTIAVETGPDNGASFKIRLPLAEESVYTPPDRPAPHPAAVKLP